MKLQLKKLQLNTESLKSTLKTYTPGLKWGVTLGLMMVVTFHSQDLLASLGNEDKMQKATGTLEKLLTGNLVKALVGAGVLAGMIFSYMKQSLLPFGTSLGTAFGYGFARSWVDSNYAALI